MYYLFNLCKYVICLNFFSMTGRNGLYFLQGLGRLSYTIWFQSETLQLPSCTSMLIKSRDCLEQSNPDEAESKLW